MRCYFRTFGSYSSEYSKGRVRNKSDESRPNFISTAFQNLFREAVRWLETKSYRKTVAVLTAPSPSVRLSIVISNNFRVTTHIGPCLAYAHTRVYEPIKHPAVIDLGLDHIPEVGSIHRTHRCRRVPYSIIISTGARACYTNYWPITVSACLRRTLRGYARNRDAFRTVTGFARPRFVN